MSLLHRHRAVLIIVLAISLGILAVNVFKRLTRPMYTAPLLPEPAGEAAAKIRRELFAELQPMPLANCELARFGEPNDGGYLMCANLLENVVAGYSYGISGYDQWGCDISRAQSVPVHQYDCFDPEQPSCAGGDTRFHDECLGATAVRAGDGQRYDMLEKQLADNGHGAARVVVKMDVEGAEWDALRLASEPVLQRIDQLVVEFHGTGDERYLATLRRLKQFFHVAHLHFNNFSCWDGLDPFPSSVYEVLLVSQRLGVADPSGTAVRPHRLDAVNNLKAPDCQFSFSEFFSVPSRLLAGHFRNLSQKP